MTADAKPLSRAQLAQFLPDHAAIKRFETAFSAVSSNTTDLEAVNSAVVSNTAAIVLNTADIATVADDLNDHELSAAAHGVTTVAG